MPLKGDLRSYFFYADSQLIIEAKSEQNDLVGMREVEAQARNSASRNLSQLGASGIAFVRIGSCELISRVAFV